MSSIEKGLNTNLVKRRLNELNVLCGKLEEVLRTPGHPKDEVQIRLNSLEKLLRKIDVNTRPSRISAVISTLGITAQELGVLRFGRKNELLAKSQKGDENSLRELIETIRSATAFWEKRVISQLSETAFSQRKEYQPLGQGDAHAVNIQQPETSLETLPRELASPICGAGIVLLVGAGASKPLGLPTMKDFWNIIKDVAEHGVHDARDVLRRIQEVHELEEGNDYLDLEELLLTLDKYRQYYDIMFDDPVFGMKSDEIFKNRYELGPYSGVKFKRYVETYIQYAWWYSAGVQRLHHTLHSLLMQAYWPKIDSSAVQTLYGPIVNLLLGRFSEPFLPVFTTNYDPVIEKYCEFSGCALEHGFEQVGTRLKWRRAKFAEYAPQRGKQNIILFKLHGSLSWRKEDNEIFDYSLSLERGPGVSTVIYPTQTKEYPYEEPFKTAYKYFEYCLRSARVLIVVGYSFRDPGISNIIDDAQDLNKNLRLILICGKNVAETAEFKMNAPKRYIALPAYFKAGLHATYLKLLEEELSAFSPSNVSG